MQKMQKLLVVVASLVIVFVVIVLAAQTSYQTIEVNVSGLDFEMLVANTSFKQSRGLSGRALEDLDVDGMIFLFDTPEKRTFWMNDMEFDLDVVWVKEGKVVKIHEGVDAPEEGEDPEMMDSSPFDVDMVLEFPAGVVDDRGIMSGYLVDLP